MRLYLVRHGQTEWNQRGRCQGHTDIPLDSEGLAQANRLAHGFAADVVIRKVFCSDLSRCRGTAEPLADRLGATLVVDPRLRERSFGDWEGMVFTELLEHQERAMEAQGCDHCEVRPPNGESLADVWDRLQSMASELEALREPSVVVAHGGSGTLLLSQLLGGTIRTARSLSFRNTAVTELELREGGYFTMRRYNDTGHLMDAEALGGSIDGTHR